MTGDGGRPRPVRLAFNPPGMRRRFPGNLAGGRVRVRRTDTQPEQESSMATKDTRPRGAARGGDQGPANPSAADQPILPDVEDQGDNGAPVADPGPEPARPAYDGPPNTVVDQLLMAAEARDADAVAAVRTVNEPPQVAQFKANLLEWLSRVDAHRGAAEAFRSAREGRDGDDDAAGAAEGEA